MHVHNHCRLSSIHLHQISWWRTGSILMLKVLRRIYQRTRLPMHSHQVGWLERYLMLSTRSSRLHGLQSITRLRPLPIQRRTSHHRLNYFSCTRFFDQCVSARCLFYRLLVHAWSHLRMSLTFLSQMRSLFWIASNGREGLEWRPSDKVVELSFRSLITLPMTKCIWL